MEKNNDLKEEKNIENRQIDKNKNVFSAIKNAYNGIRYAFEKERNIKMQIAIAILVIVLGIIFKLTSIEIILVMITIVFVMVTELINTAFENTIDLYIDVYHPRAKIAKDVAAGAVVLSTVNAVIVSYFIFFEKIAMGGMNFMKNIIQRPDILVFLSLLLVLIFSFLIWNFAKKQEKFVPSGQIMVATSIFTAIWYMTQDIKILSLVFVAILMIFANRLKSNEKTFREIIYGAILGFLGTLILLSIVIK